MTDRDGMIAPMSESASAPRRYVRILLLLVMLYAVATRLASIDAEFSRNPEGCGAFYGILARNYLRWNPRQTNLVPVESAGQLPGQPPVFYGHHPPLLPMLIAVSYAVLGDQEWQTRLSTAIFTLACVYLLYALMRNRGRPIAGLFAALLFAAVPMTLFYGGQPDVINTQLVFFILLSIAAYTHFSDCPSLRGLLLLSAAFIPAGYTDWPAYYLAPVLCAHFALTHSPRKWLWIAPFGVLCVGLFVAAYGQIAVTVGDWHWMGEQLHRRTGGGVSDRNNLITARGWLLRILQHNLHRHSLLVLLLAAGWLATLSWRRDRANQFVRLLWAFALLHIFVGREGVYDHEWWWWPLTPGLCLAAGLLLEAVGRRGAALWPQWPQSRVVVALFVPLALFAAYWACTTLPDFYSPAARLGGLKFSDREAGAAIRLASPQRNSAVALAYDETYDLPLWYYADRPIMLAVWDKDTLHLRMRDGLADVPFFRYDPYQKGDADYLAMAHRLAQHWPAAPVAMVIPRQFAAGDPAFLAWLRSNCRERDTDKFLIFDLGK